MKIIAQNKKARFNYEILDKFEAGIVLKGSEVKSIREGSVNISDSFARFMKNGELFLVNANISEYKMSSLQNHKPTSSRKLLMHKEELKRLLGKVTTKTLTLVPLKIYFNEKNRVKVEIALAKGKKLYDKRDDMKERDTQREVERQFKKH
ncbi:MAG TPA: SsrA-binding protein [Spirochaetia bacterium]|nr:MAG: SsrA-binding protein [Spirochaetes bacterium GWB1_36_13]HCL56230.1 SsrA-binding protein [Spirochaetia bacterium]